MDQVLKNQYPLTSAGYNTTDPCLQCQPL